jgi:ABC-type multidrug transport system fused ATPase/permease subunit
VRVSAIQRTIWKSAKNTSEHEKHPLKSFFTTSLLASSIRRSAQLAGRPTIIKVVLLTTLRISSGVLDIVGVLLLGQFSTSVLRSATETSSQESVIPTIPFTEGIRPLFVLLLALLAMTIKSVIAFLSSHWLNVVLQRANTQAIRMRADGELNRSLDDRGQSTSQEVHHALTSMTRSSVGGVLSPASTLIAEGSLAFMLLFTLMISSPVATLASLVALGAVSIWLYQYVARKQLRLGQQVGSATVRSLSRFQELFHGYRELVTSGFFKPEIDRFTSIEEEFSESLIRQTRNASIPRYVLETTVMICLGIVAVVSSVGSSGVESLVIVTVFAATLARLLPSLIPMQSALSEIQTVLGNATSIDYEFIEDLQSDDVHSQDITDPAAVPNGVSTAVPCVQCVDLSYVYPEAPDYALRNVTFTFEGPRWFAIHGPSGSGKSTLLDLILGLRLPSEGRLLVNGIQTDEKGGLPAGTIAFLPQRVSVFHRSLLENIAFGRSPNEIDRRRVEECLNRVGLDWLVDRIEQSPEDLVGEGGSTLSGGQLQRLGIARCLYEHPNILILDESTSGLDNDARDHIINLLHQLVADGLMLITVSHDLVLTEQAHSVVRLNRGTQDQL